VADPESQLIPRLPLELKSFRNEYKILADYKESRSGI
jgi:hypothetical protein